MSAALDSMTSRGDPGTRSARLPFEARLITLNSHVDLRGSFTEIHRDEWFDSPKPLQWNLSRSCPGTLRGVQVHARHWDYILPVVGRMWVGLHDLRPGSPTEGLSTHFELCAEALQMVLVPPGVVHGFYFETDTAHLTGTSRCYDPADHLRGRWDDPAFAFDWPVRTPIVAESDLTGMAYAALRACWIEARMAACLSR